MKKSIKIVVIVAVLSSCHNSSKLKEAKTPAAANTPETKILVTNTNKDSLLKIITLKKAVKPACCTGVPSRFALSQKKLFLKP